MMILRKLLLFMAVLNLISCSTTRDLPTVDKVDINNYIGTWYEIARLPNSFEKGLECVTANYSIKKNGKIEVLNKGYSPEQKGKFKTARGTAWIPDLNDPGRLKVSFFWPFAGDYYIISLDETYKFALIGDPSRKYLWVLSRTRDLEMEIYTSLIGIAKENGFDTDQILVVKQNCD